MGSKTNKIIVILTGAGISAESGLNTFRDSNGLWENHRIEDVATPEAYTRDPQLVWRFYSMRRIQAATAQPNLAHKALADFAFKEKDHFEVHLISQNVDVLHQRADNHDWLEPICMHGSLHQSRCSGCEMVYFDDYAYFDLEGNYAPQDTGLCNTAQRATENYLHNYKLEYRNFLPISPCCKEPIRPHIVWFGEIPLYMEKILPLVQKAHIFVTIGTSGVVYPAAGFLEMAKNQGAHTVCINREMIPQSGVIDEFLQGSAGEKVPAFLDTLKKLS
ncbi:MAG: NAD-dependent deacylase [Bdellovibrionales bacterium]|nr:NAD-dependent deacylase [Bdellovibrionales bacterium]